MDLLEQVILQPLVRDHVNILFEKVLMDSSPSIPMLRRIHRIVEQY
jgi:hypothetical protein